MTFYHELKCVDLYAVASSACVMSLVVLPRTEMQKPAPVMPKRTLEVRHVMRTLPPIWLGSGKACLRGDLAIPWLASSRLVLVRQAAKLPNITNN